MKPRDQHQQIHSVKHETVNDLHQFISLASPDRGSHCLSPASSTVFVLAMNKIVELVYVP